MKKILATLLVATMLMSCMSLAVFAASGFGTVTNPIGVEFASACDSDAATAYGEYIEATLGLSKKSAKQEYANSGSDPLYAFYYNEEDALTVESFDVSKASYIQLPLYATDDGIADFTVRVTYETDYLTLVGATALQEGSGKFGEGADANQYGYINSEDVTGLLACIYFQPVKDATTTNSSRNYTTPIAIEVVSATHSQGDVATVGTTEMKVNLTGLTYVPAAGGDDDDDDTPATDVTEEDVAKDAAPIVVPQKGGYAIGDWASETFAAANLQDNVSDEEKAAAEKYSCAFATVDLTNKNYDKVGMALIAEDGSGVRFFEAQKVAANGAYGIVFFGTEKVLGWYNVAPAVMLDGKIIYDETNVSEL